MAVGPGLQWLSAKDKILSVVTGPKLTKFVHDEHGIVVFVIAFIDVAIFYIISFRMPVQQMKVG